MAMFTTHLFFLVVQLTGWLLNVRWKRKQTNPISYIDQMIPHAKGMPTYHMHSNLSSENFEPPSLPPYIEFNDPTGLCVDAYIERFKVSQMIDSFRKSIPHHVREENGNGFAFQYDDAVEAMFETQIPEYLDPNRRPQDGEQYSYYKTMRKFPHRATQRWRGETPKASILVQPLSKMDKKRTEERPWLLFPS